MGRNIVDAVRPGIGLADNPARASEFRFAHVPTEPRDAATSGALPFSRRSQVLAHFSRDTRRGQYPPTGETAGAAWRNPIGEFCRSGFLYLREAAAKVRGVRFCDEHRARAMTLRHRGVGLPHHRRQPLTVDEALAGIILLAVIGAALWYLAWVYL